MGIMKASDAAKAVVRQSTEEVQNRGNFEVSTNFSPTTLSITHRNQTWRPRKWACDNSTAIFATHSRRSRGDPLAAGRWRPDDNIQDILRHAWRNAFWRRSNSPQNSFRECRRNGGPKRL